MALDPQVQYVLDRVREAGVLAFWCGRGDLGDCRVAALVEAHASLKTPASGRMA